VQKFIIDAVNARVATQTAELSREIHNKAKLRHHIGGLFAKDGSGAAGFRAWALDVARDLGADEEIFAVTVAHPPVAPEVTEPVTTPTDTGPDLAEIQRMIDTRLQGLEPAIRDIVADELAKRPAPMAVPTAIPIAANGGYDRNARTPFAFGPGGPGWMGRR